MAIKDTTRFRILLSYNGSEYHGWQKQKNQPTVQGEVERALKSIFKQEVSVVGAGRTDAGAHALGQTAHFDLQGSATLAYQPTSSPKVSSHTIGESATHAVGQPTSSPKVSSHTIGESATHAVGQPTSSPKVSSHTIGESATHAVGQPASSLKVLFMKKALNSILLPRGICIRRVYRAPEDFHALRSATWKTYRYFILNRSTPCVFRKKQIHWVSHPLPIDKLNVLSKRIEGRHDFKSFQNSGTPLKSTVRTVYLARWQKRKNNVVVFQIKGDGFLKQMIRNLVGAQLALLKEKEPLQKWDQIFRAKDRKSAYPTAPAEGLYLYKVSYPKALDSRCKVI